MTNSENSLVLNTDQKQKIPFTLYDAGWVVLCIGMAIGAGTIVMPIQGGIKGLWVFTAALAIAYPATFLLQKLYLRTLSETEECDSYTSVITQYLGNNWGMILGVIYFLMLVHSTFIYSIAVVFDSASYIHTFGLSEITLSSTWWYPQVLFTVLVFISSKGEKLLFKVSGPMVIVNVVIILALALVMIPHWNFSNIKAFPPVGEYLRDVLLTLPFAFFSIAFVAMLNPMNIAYRKQEEDKQVAIYKTLRAHRIAFLILAGLLLFFSFSFTFSISYEQAVSAFEQNISALAIAAQVIPGSVIKVMTVALNICTVLTAFLGVYLSFSESVKGLVMNILTRFMKEEKINQTLLNILIPVVIILALTVWVSSGFSLIVFVQLGSPLYGIVMCLIPVLLVFNVKKLHKFKSLQVYFILLFGILLVVSPFLKYIE